MAQTVSRKRLTAEAWVQSQASSCGICGGQSGVGSTFLSPVSIIRLVLLVHYFVNDRSY